MAEPLTAEELEILADLQARQAAAQEAVDLDDIQFKGSPEDITSEPLLPTARLPEDPMSTQELLQRLKVPSMRMDGMGAGPMVNPPQAELLKKAPDALKALMEKEEEDVLPPE